MLSMQRSRILTDLQGRFWRGHCLTLAPPPGWFLLPAAPESETNLDLTRATTQPCRTRTAAATNLTSLGSVYILRLNTFPS